jgi:hypothetical protein
MNGIVAVVFVSVGTISVFAIRLRKTEGGYVVFVFEHRSDSFSESDVHDSVTNHASITARTGCTKRMCVINEKFTILSLNNKPRLVVREHRASAMKLLNIKSAGLSARRGNCNLLYERMSI